MKHRENLSDEIFLTRKFPDLRYIVLSRGRYYSASTVFHSAPPNPHALTCGYMHRVHMYMCMCICHYTHSLSKVAFGRGVEGDKLKVIEFRAHSLDNLAEGLEGD